MGDQDVLTRPRPVPDRWRTARHILVTERDRVGSPSDRAALECESDNLLAGMQAS